jgi:MFS family permease
MAGLAFALALLTIPETHTILKFAILHKPAKPVLDPDLFKASDRNFREALPRHLSSFLFLLYISFAVMFAWAFIEPKFMFYAYDDLGWSSSMLGLVMSTYGIAMTLGEFTLSRLSDHMGRKPVILIGMLLFMAQFAGLAFFRNYIWIAVSFVIAGLGNALFDPALTASILDIAPAEHQARILGFKSTAASLGNIMGPALVVLVTPFLAARGVFAAAVGIVCISVLFFLVVQIRHQPIHVDPPEDARETILKHESVE